MESSLGRFDPEVHRNNVYDAFSEFIETFRYEYEAVAKDPPPALSNEAQKEWIKKDMRKLFLGRYCSRNFQRDYEATVNANERSDMTFETMVVRMKARYEPSRNYTLANHEFHNLRQAQDGESFDNFAHRVTAQSKQCKFSCGDTCTVPDIMIRDQLIIGTQNADIRENALREQWDLKDLINNGRKIESASHCSQRIQEETVDTAGINRAQKGRYSTKNKSKKKSSPQDKPKGTCENCSNKACKGGTKCKAHGMECFACGLIGHFQGARVCKKGKKKKHTRRVVSSSEESSSSSDSEDTHNSRRSNTRRLYRTVRRCTAGAHDIRSVIKKPKYSVNVVIKEGTIQAFADTGADVCVMSKANADGLKLPLVNTRERIRPYGSKALKCVGLYRGTIRYGNSVVNESIYIVDGDLETLLSGKICERLGIIKFNQLPSKQEGEAIIRALEAEHPDIPQDKSRNMIIKQYPSVFTGLGCLKNYQVHLHIDEKVAPVVQPERPIPFHLQERFDAKILYMEEMGTVEDHEGPAPWISNPVLTPKDDGDIRFTLDLKDNNKAIMSTNIPIPRVEDIKTRLAGSQYFSKLDFNQAFHQLLLDEESRKYTVFYANGCLKRHRVLPMGSKPASGELAKALVPLFAEVPEAHAIHDDLIVATHSKKQHDAALHKVLQIIQDNGLTLNPNKCEFGKQEIPF